jgi:NADP oxidoreductase coenzyme F420-dependent
MLAPSFAFRLALLGVTLFHGGDSFLHELGACRATHRRDCQGNIAYFRSSQLSLGVGFLGCGTIASAIATGLLTQDKVTVDRVAVSRRTERKSQLLLQTFPEFVTVHDNNQDIIDLVDIVFVCVLPQQTSQVLQNLTFDPSRHTLVSLVVGSLRRPTQGRVPTTCRISLTSSRFCSISLRT